MRKKTKDSLGLFQVLLFTTMFYLLSCVDSSPLGTQSVSAQSAGLPFRPIGSESAVDRYSARGRYTETGYRDDVGTAGGRVNNYGNVRQVAMQSGGFALPGDALPGGGSTGGIGGSQPGGFQPGALPNQYMPPPLNTPPQLLPRETQPRTPQPQTPNLQSAPATMPRLSTPPSYNTPSNTGPPNTLPQNNMPQNFGAAPRTLPSNVPANVPSYQNAPNLSPNGLSPMADYQPMTQPQLSNGGFATMSDCRLITPPSPYSAMSPYGNTCGCGVAPTSYAGPYTPPPAEFAAPAMMPPYQAAPSYPNATLGGGLVAPATAAPAGSLMTFGQETFPVQVGQGLWGQPVAYVPGQRVRNWLRYLSF